MQQSCFEHFKPISTTLFATRYDVWIKVLRSYCYVDFALVNKIFEYC